MATKPLQSKSKKQLPYQDNPVETLKGAGAAVKRNTVDSLKRIGGGALDQLLGYSPEELEEEYFDREARSQKKPRQEFKLFNYPEYRESQVVQKEIKELKEQIRREIKTLNKEGADFIAELHDVEKIVLEQEQQSTKETGIYHVRFLEIILSIIQTLRSKVGESKTWLEAMMSKKKKRGSLFSVLSKKKGTQYSLSAELQSARSVQ